MASNSYRTPDELDRQIGASMGEIAPDLLLIGGQIINTVTAEVYEADIAIKDDRIIRVGDITDLRSKFTNVKTIDCSESYLAPGFIDTHLHTESTLLPPTAFTTLALPRGTTTVVVDPHEIANVLGISGLDIYVKEAKKLPLEFLIEIPSCVPAAPSLETAAQLLTNKELQPLIEDQQCYFALAEMMNFPGVIYRDPDVLQKLSLADKHGRIREGHAPGLIGKELQAYLTAGINSCHESIDIHEAIEKLRLGCHIQLREGSFAKNLVHLGSGIKNQLKSALTPWKQVIIASDDRHADDLIDLGHLDHSLRLLVHEVGLDPITAIQISTINPAKHLLRPDLGIIGPGKIANIVRIKDLQQFEVLDVIARGQHVAHNHTLLISLSSPEYPAWALNTVKPKYIPLVKDFYVPAPYGYHDEKVSAHVIGALEHSLITDHLIRDISIENNRVILEDKENLAYFFLLDRYGKTDHFSKSLVSGFNFQQHGALASTVAHDCHQLILCGNDDRSLYVAMQSVIKSQGGLAIAIRNGDTINVETLPLPYAGLMSIEPPKTVARKISYLKQLSNELCDGISEPFMALSFMALPVIPKLKLTDNGLVDVEKFEIIDLFITS